MITGNIKHTWRSGILTIFVSACFTTAIAFLRIPALNTDLFIFTNLFDYIYCIVGVTNLILWMMTLDKAKIAVQDKQLTRASMIIYWYVPLALYILYYAFFPVMMGR